MGTPNNNGNAANKLEEKNPNPQNFSKESAMIINALLLSEGNEKKTIGEIDKETKLKSNQICDGILKISNGVTLKDRIGIMEEFLYTEASQNTVETMIEVFGLLKKLRMFPNYYRTEKLMKKAFEICISNIEIKDKDNKKSEIDPIIKNINDVYPTIELEHLNIIRFKEYSKSFIDNMNEIQNSPNQSKKKLKDITISISLIYSLYIAISDPDKNRNIYAINGAIGVEEIMNLIHTLTNSEVTLTDDLLKDLVLKYAVEYYRGFTSGRWGNLALVDDKKYSIK